MFFNLVCNPKSRFNPNDGNIVCNFVCVIQPCICLSVIVAWIWLIDPMGCMMGFGGLVCVSNCILKIVIGCKLKVEMSVKHYQDWLLVNP
jgi:hypothetical protein